MEKVFLLEDITLSPPSEPIAVYADEASAQAERARLVAAHSTVDFAPCYSITKVEFRSAKNTLAHA